MTTLRNTARGVIAGIERLGDGLAVIPAFFAIVMTVLITVNVILRFGFNKPLYFEFESVQIMLLCFCWLGLAYIFRKEQYITVDIFSLRFSLRTQIVIKIIGSVIGIIYFAIITKMGWDMAIESFAYGIRSVQISRFPMGPQQLIVPIAAGLLCLHLMFMIGRYIAALRAPHSPDKGPTEIPSEK